VNTHRTAAAVNGGRCVVVLGRIELALGRAHKLDTSLRDWLDIRTRGGLWQGLIKGGLFQCTMVSVEWLCELAPYTLTTSCRNLGVKKRCCITSQYLLHICSCSPGADANVQVLSPLCHSTNTLLLLPLLPGLTLQQASGLGGKVATRAGSNSINSGQANCTPTLLTGFMLPQVAICRAASSQGQLVLPTVVAGHFTQERPAVLLCKATPNAHPNSHMRGAQSSSRLAAIMGAE
jgi:hypothetical protein